MDLYPRNKQPELDPQLFQNPTAEYRGAPFWSWNNKLDEEQLLRQIEFFKAMGMGGMHIHPRTGLATEYLGPEFMRLVRVCVEKAQQEGLLVWLYDEDRWPSGAAGGIVTRDPQFRARHLLFTRTPYDGEQGKAVLISAARAARTGNGKLLARYHVVLRDGYLSEYRRLADDEDAPEGGAVWYAYLETALESPWFNNQTYVDTLNKKAIERFIEVTHERYAETIGEYFGNVVPAIFTDEPQFTHKQSFFRADDTRDIILPFTTDFFDTYRQTYNQNLEDALPELFWELPERKASLARYRYHDHLCERFSHAFADTIGAWCRAHNIALTGHMMEEPTLQSQTAALGEAMRSYRSFMIPGIDMLCDWREYTTAKQAQSAAHQYGRPGVLSELYGVTNWDFPFAGHKGQGDWQAALGVSVRVHHLSWVSMAGEAKRDYPASISYQSPWYREYPLIEDHFARLNTVLTRGKPHVRVGVIHPIESYWLCFGPLEQTKIEREERETSFEEITRWLLFGLIDFDFIAESLLPSLCPQQAGAQLQVGEAAYDVVIVPSMRTMRSTTLERLERFAQAGGTVVFAGEIPSLVDVEPSDRVQKLAEASVRVGMARGQVLGAVESFREVEVRLADGGLADSILHQIRDDGQRRSIFFCNTDRDRARERTQIRIKGQWRVTVMDTLTGEMYRLRSKTQDGQTVIDWDFAPHGSLLLSLEPGSDAEGVQPVTRRWVEYAPIADPVPVTLAEPNVLLVSMAQYRLDGEEWQPEEEILRLDTTLRKRLGWPLRMEALAQPWTNTDTAPPSHTVSLKFRVESAIDVAAPSLALEDAAQVAIFVDGERASSEITGWFVDEAIQTVRLPALSAGTHEIMLTIPYSPATNVEWCYLLGDFGVEVRGRHTRLIAPVRELAFGDWTRQGLPFYAGNVTYHCTIAGQDAEVAVKFPKFKATLLSVALDGNEAGKVAIAPFQVELGRLSPGTHTLDITAYGNRVNAFGCVHNADEKLRWFGPNAWRTVGDQWSYEYQLKQAGILVAPKIMLAE